MSKGDADVDALLGFSDEEEVPVKKGWFSWLFASCTPRPPVTVNAANRELLRTSLHLDQQRTRHMESYDEHIEKAKEHIEEHKQTCKTPVKTCMCNAARTARIHMQNASNVKKQIVQIEQKYSTLSQYSTTLDSMKSVQMISQSMAAANTALSAEIRKHGDGRNIENLADQMSEHQLRANEINQTLGMTFNYATGEAVTGIEIDDSVLAELEDILEEDNQPQQQTRIAIPSAVSNPSPYGSRRIRRPHEIPSAEPVAQLQ